MTSRGDVHYVVTEYGVAQLWGKSIRERAAALLEIAHPDVRSELLNEAKARHFLLPDHPLPNPPSTKPELIQQLRSGERVRVRAVRVSDEDALQDLLYRLSDDSTFLRFFGHRCTHPHREVLRMVEIDQTCAVALIACLAETDELLGIARADADPRTSAAELAVTIADVWQNKGLGSLLLEQLARAAHAAGFSSLTAQVLPANGRMQRLLRRQGFACSGEPGPDPLTFHLSLRPEPT